MSAIRVQIPKPIQEVINILRSTKAYQIYGPFFDGKGGACAVGAIRIGFGTHDLHSKDITDAATNEKTINARDRYYTAKNIWEEHISRHGGDNWITMNDRKRMTFKEIADTMEKSYMEHGL